MTEPIYDEATERAYSRLPQVYRSKDYEYGWQMKSWLSGILGELQAVDTYISRFDYAPPEDGGVNDTSELVDPMKADAAWLEWLSQLVGVRFAQSDTEAVRRSRIASAIGGVKAGTVDAIAAAVREVLTGAKNVFIYRHSTDAGVGSGSEWDVLIMTVATETLSDPIQAVIDAGAKPAGVKLWHLNFGATWQTIETQRPTWQDWENAGTWQKLEETGL